MELDIRAKTADSQQAAREILTRCLPEGVFGSIFANCWNDGGWYAICYRLASLGGGYITVGIDPANSRLTA